MTEVTQTRNAMQPGTGEIVDLAQQTTTDLAVMRDEVREMRSVISEWAHALDDEITSRLDFEGTRSAAVGAWKVTTTAPTVWETDEKALRDALLTLALGGVLSMSAVDKAVEVTEVLKAHRRGLNALHKHADERVREVVAAHDREVPNGYRRVTVCPA